MRRAALIPIVLLAGCIPVAEEVPREPEAATNEPVAAYAIRGQDRPNWGPGWRAVILDGRILLDSPTSAGWYSVPLPEARIADGRRTFAAGPLTLAIEEGACRLSELGAALPDRILLDWDGGRFEGCGGARALPSQIAGTVWELVGIGGDPAPSGRSPSATLIFGRNGSLGGTLSCNDGGIRATWTASGGFVAGPDGFESTAMGCNDPAGEAFGRRFWHGLSTARSWRRDGDRLRITFADGSQAELRFLL